MAPRPEQDTVPSLLVYGGSFDPPHQGHVGYILKALTHFPKSRVLVVPTPTPPRVGKSAKDPEASFGDRICMCREAFGPLGDRVEVSAIEATLPAPSYTIETLRVLQKMVPGKLGLMIGQDQLAQFDAWREPLSILKLASLLVLARPQTSVREMGPESSYQEDLLKTAFDVCKRLDLVTTWTPSRQEVVLTPPSKEWEGRIFFLSGIVGSTASRDLRAALKVNQAISIEELPPGVRRYIKERGLYRASTSAENGSPHIKEN